MTEKERAVRGGPPEKYNRLLGGYHRRFAYHANRRNPVKRAKLEGPDMDYWTARFHEEEGLEHEHPKNNEKKPDIYNVVYFDVNSSVLTPLARREEAKRRVFRKMMVRRRRSLMLGP